MKYDTGGGFNKSWHSVIYADNDEGPFVGFYSSLGNIISDRNRQMNLPNNWIAVSVR